MTARMRQMGVLKSGNVSEDRRMDVVGQLNLSVGPDGREDPQELQAEPADKEGHDLVGPHLIAGEAVELAVLDGQADGELFTQTGDTVDPTDVFLKRDLNCGADVRNLDHIALTGETGLKIICQLLDDEVLRNFIRLNLIGHVAPFRKCVKQN